MLFRVWFNPILRQAKQSAPATSEQAEKVDNRVVRKWPDFSSGYFSYFIAFPLSGHCSGLSLLQTTSFIASGRLLMSQQHLSSKLTAPGQGLNFCLIVHSEVMFQEVLYRFIQYIYILIYVGTVYRNLLIFIAFIACSWDWCRTDSIMYHILHLACNLSP